MTISVVIPVYNVELYIRQCVDSVLNQTYQDLEVILVDDGSTDKCPSICDEYAKIDSRVVVLHKENGGLSDARNFGIRAATGDYISFLDSDDYFDDLEALARLAQRLQITKAEVLNYSYKKVYSDGRQLYQFQGIADMPHYLTKKQQLEYLTENGLYIASACNKVILCSVLKTMRPFEKGALSEDIEWCLYLLLTAKSFDFVCENFYCYRQRNASITHSFTPEACRDLKNHIQKCLEIESEADAETEDSANRYIGYQLATFVAVQAQVDGCPPEYIQELKKYAWLLRFHGKSRKVYALYIINRLIGFPLLCKLARQTRRLWL